MSEKEPSSPAVDESGEPPELVAAPEIVQRLEPYVRPDRIEEASRVVSMMIAQSHSGPLPPAREFANYDRALPGAAERILLMAEREQSHRHTIESGAVRFELSFKARGQLFALGALVASLVVVAYIAWLGHAAAAVTLGTGVIVGVVALFLGQKWAPGSGGGDSGNQ